MSTNTLRIDHIYLMVLVSRTLTNAYANTASPLFSMWQRVLSVPHDFYY